MPEPLSLDGLYIAVALVAAAWTAYAIARVAGKAAGAIAAGVVVVPGVVAEDPALPAAYTVVAGFVLYWNRRGLIDRSTFTGLPLQVVFIVAGYLTYVTGRKLVVGSRADAIANAREVVSYEQALNLWIEPSIQEALNHGAIIEVLNQIYLFAYYPVPAVALLVFFLRDRPGFFILRNSLGISCVLALTTIAIFPAAPPRLMPGLEIIDTLEVGGSARSFANQYAAVPSLHVGWLSLVGLMMAVRGPTWIKILAPIPPVVMGITVIATGNHYWLDFVIGTAFAAGPALVMLVLMRDDAYTDVSNPRTEASRAT